jgi:exopolyphosphatase / guanosine-5'-triphosphate,3'-diphosphate pyrophosphatase
MRASIDIGSNSTLLLLAEVEGSALKLKDDYAEVTALGKGIDKTKLFAPESMELTFKVLKNYKEICDRHKVSSSEIIATATEASRVVRNSKEFYSKVKKELGIEVKLISAEGEAFYTALGASLGASASKEILALCDIGGASTELILFDGQNKSLLDFISLPFGSVRVKDWSDQGLLDGEFKRIYKLFESTKLSVFKNRKILWTAGTMTALTAVIQKLPNFDASKVHQSCFKRSDLENLIAELEHLGSSYFNEKYPYLGKRAQTLVSGAQVALQLSKWIEINEFTISNFGLRHGTLYQGKINEKFLIDGHADDQKKEG